MPLCCHFQIRNRRLICSEVVTLVKTHNVKLYNKTKYNHFKEVCCI